jgi:DNA repair protein RadC
MRTISDNELLEVVIGKPNATKLNNWMRNNEIQVSDLGHHDSAIQRLIGVSAANKISAAIILASRISFTRRNSAEAKRIRESQDLYELLSPLMFGLSHEELWVVMLNNSNQVIKVKRISEGGWNYTAMDPKKIFHEALSSGASSIAIAHNHPSGKNIPSEYDIKMTKKVVNAGEMLGLSCLDHIIVTDKDYYSFADNGLIKPMISTP